jgi:hypothetical protein
MKTRLHARWLVFERPGSFNAVPRLSFIILMFSFAMIVSAISFNILTFKSYEVQNRYRAGIKIYRADSTWQTLDFRPITFLRDNDLFSSREETTLVKKAKAILGNDYQHLYFDNLWGLVEYLNVIGASDKSFELLIRALDERWLVNTARCVNFRSCEGDGEHVNLTQLNAKRLFQHVRRNYIENSLRHAKQFRYSRARSSAILALKILRSAHIPTESGEDVLNHYNYSLVLSIFLSLVDSRRGDRYVEDIEKLQQVIDHHYTFIDEIKDVYILRYALGLRYFWNDCVVDASKMFSDTVKISSYDPMSELFAFMSVRALARPMRDKNVLVLRKAAGRGAEDEVEIVVKDCRETHKLDDWYKKYSAAVAEAAKYIRKAGFLGDLSYYGKIIDESRIDRTKWLLEVDAKQRQMELNAKQRPEDP